MLASHLLNNFRLANSEIQNYSPDGAANNNCITVRVRVSYRVRDSV